MVRRLNNPIALVTWSPMTLVVNFGRYTSGLALVDNRKREGSHDLTVYLSHRMNSIIRRSEAISVKLCEDAN